MKKISINELPKYNPWVARLLGIEPFNRPFRNISKIDAEYDKDKYAKLLAYYQKKGGASAQEIKMYLLWPDHDVISISREGQLFLTSPDDFRQLQDQIFVDVLAEPISTAQTVIDLGCGYGHNFFTLRDAYPGRVWIGGDYSQNAIKLASLLFADCSNVSVKPFNWYDDSWPIFETLEGKALVLTVQSVEQLPSVACILPTLEKYREKITAVVHLEPIYELADKESTLGLMRRAYTLMNDYNTDLLSVIKAMRVQILGTHYDLIGGNPMNPLSMVYWRF